MGAAYAAAVLACYLQLACSRASRIQAVCTCQALLIRVLTAHVPYLTRVEAPARRGECSGITTCSPADSCPRATTNILAYLGRIDDILLRM